MLLINATFKFYLKIKGVKLLLNTDYDQLLAFFLASSAIIFFFFIFVCFFFN